MIEYIATRDFSLGHAAAYLAVVYFVFFWAREFYRSREISRLGYRAPKIRTWPFGIDFIYKVVKLNLQYKDVELWKQIFRQTNTDELGTGTFTSEVILSGSFRMIWTADPENIKAMLTGQFADFGRGDGFHGEWEPFLGDGIFSTDGEKWRFARQLLRPMFARERVVNVETFEHHVQKLIALLGSDDGAEVEISRLLYRYTLDAATDFLLGHPVGSLDDEHNKFAQWFGNIQKVQSLIARSGPLQRLVDRRGYYRDIRQMEAFLDPIITEALSLSPDELNHKLTRSETFLHQLARATRDRKVIRDQLVTILLAGRDSTACTLSWAFFELARHPEVTAKLRRTIVEHLGTDGRAPTYAQIKEMKYLTWVINETLRRYPIVPHNIRAALKPTTLPRGGGPDGSLPIGLRAGTAITYSTLSMHRRRDLYPPISEDFPYDPDEWAPDRWATWTPKPWQYIPFNGGPRICIGQQFATVEMAYTICRVLQQFDHIIDLGGKDQEVLKCEIVLIPGEGIKVGFQRSELG